MYPRKGYLCVHAHLFTALSFDLDPREPWPLCSAVKLELVLLPYLKIHSFVLSEFHRQRFLSDLIFKRVFSLVGFF